MQGCRIYRNNGQGLIFSPGDYGKDKNGKWFARAPKGHMGSLVNHDVTEHEDGTITVSPSILIVDGADKEIWHGYLIKGVWKEC